LGSPDGVSRKEFEEFKKWIKTEIERLKEDVERLSFDLHRIEM